jgi:HEAT repeat protein
MKIVRVEPTPSPNSMKLTLDASLNPGVRLNYERGAQASAPSYIRRLLAIEGVTGVYQTADFLALERHPKGDWPSILSGAEAVLGVADTAGAAGTAVARDSEEVPQDAAYGEVTVRVQTFRGIPMQVRISAGLEEKRAALPERFQSAAATAGLGSPNLIMERKLEDRGIRYGSLEEVLEEVVRELEAVYDDDRLQQLVERSLEAGAAGTWSGQEGAVGASGIHHSTEQAAVELAHSDWRVRYAALSRLTPGLDTLPLLLTAMKDENISVRRLAVVYAGEIKEGDTLPLLIDALGDRSPVIRRTAGDSLSDRGDAAAVPAMEKALSDPSKLVRWRAARFLYELGGEASLDALKEAEKDEEFEVRLQARLAVQRIQSGEEAQGTIWQQMMRERQ